jgi:hypothetical protein
LENLANPKRRIEKMLKKTKILYALLLIIGIPPTHALDCMPVAKIFRVDKIDHVLIFRGGKTKEWANWHNQELCAGDKVIVPKVISHLKIGYYSHPSKEMSLKAGDFYQVEALPSPCGMLCKGINHIKLLAYNLTHNEPEQPVKTSVGGRGYEENVPIFMILASYQSTESPLYLFSRDGAIPLFWRGGQSPYQVEVKDEQGKRVVSQTKVETNTFSLTLPDTDSNQRYSLLISSKGSPVYQKPLVFAVPPFPPDPKIDKFERFATLLTAMCLDDKKNWRLEIWRQLHEMPKSQEKERFMGNLAMDDIDLSGIGSCL